MYKHFSFQDRVILQYHLDNNPRCSAKEIATILKKSKSAIHYELKTNTKTLLTIFFMNSKFHLAIKYNRKNSNINTILTRIYDEAAKLGYKLFDVILTDNGPEFRNLPAIEKNDEQVNRLRLFYCDPYRSCQKAECERNHGLIRRILTKGHSFDSRTQDDIDSALSHINSYPRGSLNNCTPYDLFTSEYDLIITGIFNIERIDVKNLRLIRR